MKQNNDNKSAEIAVDCPGSRTKPAVSRRVPTFPSFGKTKVVVRRLLSGPDC